jgi:BirA family biotin operon repressor/biotin-[acetyl-CoA-carboxylase] ligase
MDFEVVHIHETDSTNRWLREHGVGQMAVWADYQTAGRGCGTNTWESERGQNLLFSLLIHPQGIAASQQFFISMAISVALVRMLSLYIKKGVSIKWPNDIYVDDRKICGILIENRLSGTQIRESIIGVGLNLNQTRFLSDAPNPVSLRMLIGKTVNREECLHQTLEAFSLDALDQQADYYRAHLYRREGFYSYRDRNGDFDAELVGVVDDGHLLLRDREGQQRRYAFKEVIFIL